MSRRKDRLYIVEGLTLPLDFASARTAYLAEPGAGKSNALVRTAEEFYRVGIPFATIDSKGDWWGIQSSEDGKGPGLDVPVFGAGTDPRKNKPKPDLPLQPTSGKYIADLVVRERLACVLDVSGFETDADRARFLRDFADRVFRTNEEVLHLFLEEVDEYAPQQPRGVDVEILHIMKRIGKQGRQLGLGYSLATQRSAVVHKSLLNMVQVLFAMRTSAPHDRDAIADWLTTKGESKEVLESLPELSDGEAWAISPHLLKMRQRVRFQRRQTFDSGATPKVGERRVVTTRAQIDLDRVREQMSEAIEEAKANDPDELKVQLAQERRETAMLRRQVADLEKRPPSVAEPEIVHVNLPVLEEGVAESLASTLEAMRESIRNLDEVRDGLRKTTDEAGAQVEAAKSLADAGIEATRKVAAKPPQALQKPPASRDAQERSVRRPPQDAADVLSSAAPPAIGITRSRQRVLDSIAWLAANGFSPTRKQIAWLLGVHQRNKGLVNNLGTLKSAGLVDYPRPGEVELTAVGIGEAEFVEAPRSSEELQQRILGQLPTGRRSIVEMLLRREGQEATRVEIAEHLGVHDRNKGLVNNLGFLRLIGLIEYPAPGRVRVSDALFLAGDR